MHPVESSAPRSASALALRTNMALPRCHETHETSIAQIAHGQWREAPLAGGALPSTLTLSLAGKCLTGFGVAALGRATAPPKVMGAGTKDRQRAQRGCMNPKMEHGTCLPALGTGTGGDTRRELVVATVVTDAVTDAVNSRLPESSSTANNQLPAWHGLLFFLLLLLLLLPCAMGMCGGGHF